MAPTNHENRHKSASRVRAGASALTMDVVVEGNPPGLALSYASNLTPETIGGDESAGAFANC